MTAPLPPRPAARPLSEAELDRLQSLLDQLPSGHEALDVVMLDGYLCGVLLQPRPVPQAQWLKHVTDIDGKPVPAGYPLEALRELVLRRHAELNRAIERREWFDPWVYQLDAEASPSETVLPWVAGFATAMDLFPDMMARHESALLEPLATLYRHFDPEDLEDADELLAEIETLELPESLPEAVEDLVRSVLLIADVARPRVAAAGGPRRGPPSRRTTKPAPRR
ncbi:MAG: YecA family protein [Burkholderiaceae bacterium]